MERPCTPVADVITTGSPVLRALEAAGDGCVGVHTILFRGSDHDRARLEAAAPLHMIFTQDDLLYDIK